MNYPDSVELAMYNIAESVFKIRVLATEQHRAKAKKLVKFILEEWDERDSRAIADIIEMAFSLKGE